MTASRPRKPRPPLDDGTLEELALFYVGRFATTRAKLRTYLARKVRERGWDGTSEPDLVAVAERFAGQGYIDDAAFAVSSAQSLAARGYGKRRLADKLRAAGVEEHDSVSARELSDSQAVSSALRFAERRRLGPFAAGLSPDREQREKSIAAFVRAGHSFGLARAIASMPPGATVDAEDLADRMNLR